MHARPYLTFQGQCEDAINFYQGAIGATVEMMVRFKESPQPHMHSPDMNEKVMHATLRVGDTIVFATDGGCRETERGFHGFSMNLTVPDDAAAEDRFTKLSADGGKVQMPLGKTFFASKFGIVTDRFGLTWMVMVG